MTWSTLTRRSTLLCFFFAASGWIPLPIPTSLLKHAQTLLPEGSVLSAHSLQLRWASGEIAGKELQVHTDDSNVVTIRRVKLFFDTLPWSAHFLEPRAILLEDGETNLDLLRPIVEPLFLEREAQSEPPSLRVSIQNLSASTALASGDLSFTILEALGQSSSQGVQLQGNLSTPYGFAAHAWFEHRANEFWNLDIDCPPTEITHLDLLPAEIRGDSFELKAHIDSSDAQVNLRLENTTVKVTDPPMNLELEEITIKGPLSSGIQLEAVGRLQGTPLRVEAWMRRDKNKDWAARLEGEAHAIVLDKDRIDWIQQLDPGTAEVLEALELDGATSANISWDWRGDGDGQWLVHAPFQNLGITYRGFLEEDGDRPSFPYPVQQLSGDFLATGRRLLFHSTGSMGSALLQAEGTVLITDGPVQMGIDLDVNGLEMDNRITSALSGTPEASAIWRDLGGPSGGEADLKLRLRRKAEDEFVRVDLEGEVRGTTLRPSFLPIPIELNGAWIHWAPGSAEFAGPVRALGSEDLLVRGEARSVLNGNLPAISMKAVTEKGLAPVVEDRRILEGFLGLPEGMSGFQIEGPSRFDVGVRRPGSDSQAQVLIETEGRGMNLRWDSANTNWEHLVGDFALAMDGKQLLFSAPEISAQCCNGELLVSGELLHFDQEERGLGTIVANNLEVKDETVRFARALAGLDPEMNQPIAWSGIVHLVAELNLLEPGKNRGRIQLDPLEVRQGVLLPSEGASLRGRFRLKDTTLVQGEIDLTGVAGNMELHDIRLEPLDDGFLLEADLDSPKGIEISDRFAALLSPDAWQAFQRIGLRGRVGADVVAIRLNSSPDGSSFRLDGSLLLREMGVDAAPVFKEGFGVLEVQDFEWKNPQEFGGELHLKNASCNVAGFSFSDASGNLSLTPSELHFDSFEGKLLNGTVGTSSFVEEGGSGEVQTEGHLRLGLQNNAPISFLLYLDSISLARLREELDLEGDLAGSMSGRLDFTSESPSPLDYKGIANLSVNGGVLGTVPVLSRMWAVAGVRPPIFNSGNFTLRARPNVHRGRIRLEEFDLKHELLQVHGKGWIGLDSYLNVKATVRSGIVPLLGWGIPLISDLFFDPLVEQDIIGPAENPIVTQRLARKLDRERNKKRVPFPLWIPGFQHEDWWKSPAFPATHD